jgi:hypothetical protein
MKKEASKDNLLPAGYAKIDASYLDQLAAADIAESGKLFFSPVTMQFNLGSGIVNYDDLQAAIKIIKDRFNLLRQNWSPTPVEDKQEQINELNFQMEELGAKLNNKPALNLPFHH